MKRKFGIRGWYLSRCFGWPVADAVPIVRPWKPLQGGDDVGPGSDLAGQLDGGVVRLRSAVAEEDAGEGRRQQRHQAGEEPGPHWGVGEPGVGVLEDLLPLLHESGIDRRRGVPEAGDAPAGGEVQIPSPVLVPDVDPFPPLDRDREPGGEGRHVAILDRHGGCGIVHTASRSPCTRADRCGCPSGCPRDPDPVQDRTVDLQVFKALSNSRGKTDGPSPGRVPPRRGR
ncbi:MAG: hypothetical protein QMC96_09555 [Methanomicrobiales archaeon]|nr:hypothetical protein [Methanomicrobiales archaeon]